MDPIYAMKMAARRMQRARKERRQPRYFKLYGNQRSGTNYLKSVLDRNFPGVQTLVNVLGWKHGLPVDVRQYVDSHTAEDGTIRDCHGRATRHRAHDLRAALEEGRIRQIVIVRHPARTLAGIRKEWPKRDLVACARQWNERYTAWLAMPGVIVVRHEDLLKRFDDEMTRIALAAGLPPRRRWQNIDTVVRPGCDRYERINDQPYHPHTAELSAEVARIADERIDWKLAARLGYERAGKGLADGSPLHRSVARLQTKELT